MTTKLTTLAVARVQFLVHFGVTENVHTQGPAVGYSLVWAILVCAVLQANWFISGFGLKNI